MDTRHTRWIGEQGLGVVIPNFAHIGVAVRELIRDLPKYRSATLKVRNRAAFELPGILHDILRCSARAG